MNGSSGPITGFSSRVINSVEFKAKSPSSPPVIHRVLPWFKTQHEAKVLFCNIFKAILVQRYGKGASPITKQSWKIPLHLLPKKSSKIEKKPIVFQK